MVLKRDRERVGPSLPNLNIESFPLQASACKEGEVDPGSSFVQIIIKICLRM